MQRRSFFGGMMAFLGLSSVAAAATSEPGAFDPTVPRRDARGSAITRVYRLTNGEWWEIKPEEAKKGDSLIHVGQEGGRLWMCLGFTAKSDFERPDLKEAGQIYPEPESVVQLVTVRGSLIA